MRYLVTGGAGFIGSHLVEHLLEQGEDVVVLDDFSTGRRENLAPFQGRFELVEASITDYDACRRAVDGADRVLHQAALGSVPRSIDNPHHTHDVNATGTLNVLRAAVDAGVKRVVFAASSSAYGDTEELPKHEGMPTRPRSPYAVTKVTGEHYCRAFHASYGLETVALRYFNVFGPRQDPDSEYAAVIPKFVKACLTEAPPCIYGDGEQTRDFTFVRDVVRANLLAADSKDAVGTVVNVAGGERISLNRLLAHVKEITGSKVEAVRAAPRPGDVRDSLADLRRAAELLGYRPAVEVRQGLLETIDYFRKVLEGAAAG
jgi:nucleoside-diphosphate-sugar epimerase